FANCGGSGMTLGLLLAIFIASKRAEYRDLAKMSFIPGIFNINEPIIFGVPIIYNPYLAIPFLLAPMASATIAYFATRMELIRPMIANIPFPTPVGLGGFI
ncbi:PTS transporter subunit EIIC, partial [Enterococcus faecium]|uniref:PTS transporter subunit EIIC n=1 Tax=Enterococcus faecium TaxID=1352 RepID=UPI0039FC508C